MPSIFTPAIRQPSTEDAPVAHARPTDVQPVGASQIEQVTARFKGATVGQSYFGPAGVSEDGVPWIILLAKDDRVPRMCRQEQEFGLLGWLWNNSPSGLLSLTLMGHKRLPANYRWMGDPHEAVALAIRRNGRLRVNVVNPGGARSGWFEAVFGNDRGMPSKIPSLGALEALWGFAMPGIKGSKIGVRFDPAGQDDLTEEPGEQIRLWRHPSSDLWKSLDYPEGPWGKDLEPRDTLTLEWARAAHRHRSRMAGFVQFIKERQEIDGERPLMDEQGHWQAQGPQQQVINRICEAHPAIRQWLAAMVGPAPDAQRTHEAAFALLHDPAATFTFAADLMRALSPAIDAAAGEAIKASLEAALLDARITAHGRRRPWLQNSGHHTLTLRSFDLDMDADPVDFGELWRNGLEFGNLIDAGEWFGPRDLPAPLSFVNEALGTVRVEGCVDDAKARVMQLLHEAQQARQWSIPWGARVQIDFGPFVAMRIFEKEGEFTCLFLDEKDRYLYVAIGLTGSAPRIAGVELIRSRDDDGELVWNDDAEVSLQLIAAAIVRDFLVVEERESLFTTRPMRRRIRGRDERTVIYLPRVRYSRPLQAGIDSDPAEPVRSRHSVSYHLRRANNASAAQRFLAQRYGVALPQGFTFVKPHERGLAAHEERVRIYRSRSASRMIFQALQTAPEGSRPAWFDFERDCARLLAARGMRVIHQAAHRDGDGGVDLFAVDADGTSWVVQCKCWAAHRKVGPDVLRELVGAIEAADRGSDKRSCGMVMTTSALTAPAAAEAAQLGFEVFDGAKLALELAKLSRA